MVTQIDTVIPRCLSLLVLNIQLPLFYYVYVHLRPYGPNRFFSFTHMTIHIASQLK